jgi:enoyl-CoA hydratase
MEKKIYFYNSKSSKIMSVFLTKLASITTKYSTRLLLPFSSQSNINQHQYTFFSTINYETKNRLAYITLNRPNVLNSINDKMPKELSECVEKANNDPSVHVIVLSGAGKAFCSGYDLTYYAQNKNEYAVQEMPWDPMKDYTYMKRNTEYFMSLFRSPKPTLCKVNGDALAGGSDIALCCDIIIMANEAHIGYMPARVWGCPTTAMWIYR